MWTTVGIFLLAAAAVVGLLGTPGSPRRILGSLMIVVGGAALLMARAQPIAQAREMDQQRRALCSGMVENIHRFKQLYHQWHITKYSHVDRLPPDLQTTMYEPEDQAQAQAHYDAFNHRGLGHYCIANFSSCTEQLTEWHTSLHAPFLAHLDVLARAYEAGAFESCTPWHPPSPPPK